MSPSRPFACCLLSSLWQEEEEEGREEDEELWHNILKSEVLSYSSFRFQGLPTFENFYLLLMYLLPLLPPLASLPPEGGWELCRYTYGSQNFLHGMYSESYNLYAF